jgi:hypothetical protein
MYSILCSTCNYAYKLTNCLFGDEDGKPSSDTGGRGWRAGGISCVRRRPFCHPSGITLLPSNLHHVVPVCNRVLAIVCPCVCGLLWFRIIATSVTIVPPTLHIVMIIVDLRVMIMVLSSLQHVVVKGRNILMTKHRDK